MVKGQKLFFEQQKSSKTLLNSGFLNVFVPRETECENQIVTRETYAFYTHLIDKCVILSSILPHLHATYYNTFSIRFYPSFISILGVF